MKNVRILLVFMVLGTLGCSDSYKSLTKEKDKYAEYEELIPRYQKLLTKTQNPELKADINYQIAECYRLSNRMAQSLPYYEAAVQGGKSTDKLLVAYGLALKANGKYKEAGDVFAKASKNRNEASRRAKQELESLALVENLSKPHKNIEIIACEGINTPESEYSPAIWRGKVLFSSNRRREAIYAANGKGFDDIYMYETNNNQACAGSVSMLNSIINVDNIHDASPTFSANGKNMIFARSSRSKEKEPFEIKLYESVYQDTGWTKPRELSEINSGYWDACPSLSPDGNTLVFASNRPGKNENGGSYGGLDLYRSTKTREGTWSEPMNLGRSINTSGNEMFPFLVSKDIFYFASDGHVGLGGLDIHRATKNGAVYKVSNIGAPINSSYDDFAICFKDTASGFFTSNRPGGAGDDDIYAFKINSKKDRVILYYLAGTVTEKNSQKPISNAVVKLFDSSETLLDSSKTDKEGGYRFKIQIPLDTDFKIGADKSPDYFPYSGEFSSKNQTITPDEFADDTIEVVFDKDFEMGADKFVKLLEKPNDSKFEIEMEILYDLDQDSIRQSEMPKLDELAEFLLRNPNVKIELGSHTDARASFAYNMDLSERRARSAVQYLVSKGVDPQRIIAKGYGKTQLKINKAVMTEEDHQKNRRTTLRRIAD